MLHSTALIAHPDPAPPPISTPALALHNVHLRWPGAHADTLQIEQLTLDAGQTLFLRGPSGCGKSSLLSLAAGVLLPQAGTVQVLGQHWARLGAAARDQYRADHLGYLFQQFNLLPYLSVLDNVRLPLRFSKRRAARAAAATSPATGHDAAQTLLAASGLAAGLWQRPAGQLSVGQQQRVAAARALIGAPALVLADEPTSALDDDLRQTFMTLLLDSCAAAGSALLFVSHDLRLADRFERVVDLPAINRVAAPAASRAVRSDVPT